MLVKPLKKADFQGQTVHLPMVKLVGGFNNLEKYYIVSWDDYPIYEMETKIHVPNHQPGYTYISPIDLLLHSCHSSGVSGFPGSPICPNSMPRSNPDLHRSVRGQIHLSAGDFHGKRLTGA